MVYCPAGLFFLPFPPLSVDVIVTVASGVPYAAPVVPRFAPLSSLDLSPTPLPPPPLSLGLLHTPAPPLATPPLAHVDDIVRKDEDVGNRTGVSEALWSTAGGSALHRKCPSRPLAMVRDGISRPLYLHRCQQYRPLHCWSEFRHLHVLANGCLVDQVECQVQLQHHSTSMRTCLTDGHITIELIPTPCSSFPLLFLPCRYPGRLQVTQHAAGYSLAIPALIGYCSGVLSPKVQTVCT